MHIAKMAGVGLAVVMGLQGWAGAASGNGNGALHRRDRTFMTSTAQNGMAEVALGQAASQKASSPAVKEFADRMVADHTKANGELTELAGRLAVKLPADVGRVNMATAHRLSKLSGDGFDRAYMNQMVKDHEAAVAAFKTEAKHGSGEAKAWAASTLPTLEDHLKMARGIVSQFPKAHRAVGGAKGSHPPIHYQGPR